MILYTGEQKTISVDVADKSGEALDLSQCSDIKAYFVVNETEVAKYAYVSSSGYNALSLDSRRGRFNITILAADTSTITNGLKGEIQFKLIYADGTKTEGRTQIFSIKNSLLKD